MGQFLPIVAAATTGILVGAAMVATRSVVDQIGPASLALLRYLIGVCCLLPPVLLSQRVKFMPRDLVPIALLGIGQFGILIALLNYGLRFIPSARAALLFATMPLLTLLLATLLGRETLTLRKCLGVLLTVAGVGFAIGEQSIIRSSGISAWVGELAVLGSALSGAVCSVLYRPYLQKYPTLSVSAVAMLSAVCFLAVLATGEGFFQELPHFTVCGWMAVLFIGVSSGIGYYCWLWALGHASPTRVTVFLSLSPITAALLGAPVLSERLSLAFLLALACLTLGLWCTHGQD
jgi:drug/metabolite transporter (DMT)-like permease